MTRMRVVVVALLGAIAIAPAAAESCRHDAVFDSWGVVKLVDMTPTQMDRLATRTRWCDFKHDNACTYRDKNGTLYYVADGYVQSKELDLRTAPKSAKLPFGLSRKDTPSSAAAKFRNRYGVVLELGQATDQHSAPIQLLEGNCTKADMWLDMTFDLNGRLLTVKTWVPSPRD